MKTIYFVRHGESEYNHQDIFAGWTDCNLTELGANQAAAAALSLSNVADIEVVYSSDLMRAKRTGKIIAEKNNWEFHTTEDLREIYLGVWEALTLEQIEERDPDLVKQWFADYSNFTYPAGESPADVVARASAFINAALKDYDTILIVSHALTIASLLSHYLFGSVEYLGAFKVKNARIQKIVSVGNRFALERFNGK